MQFYLSRFKDMETKEFEAELLTPMFLGGADKNKAELRVPSIKGVLRFWWRAINAHLFLDKLKEQEAEIFGDAGAKYGKSKIQIKINSTMIYNRRNRANPVPHKNVRFSFPCFNPGEKFSLNVYGDKNVFELFKLMSILGGLGKRSRRGFGSFKINKIDGEDLSPVSSIEEILNLLQNISKNVFKIDNDKIIRADNVNADYAYVKSIEVGTIPFKTYNELLIKIGQASHDNNSDYTGFARGQERFSSPVYVSVIKSETGYKPVLTTLNTAFKSKQSHGVDKSSNFKSDILSGGSK